MKEVKFNAKKSDFALINKIVARAKSELGAITPLDLSMDLTAVHCNDVKIDFEKLLRADDYNFSHDIYGIMDHIDRKTGKLRHCFVPRCAKN